LDAVSPTAKKTCKTGTLSDRDAKTRTRLNYLGHDNDLLSRDLEFLESLPEDDLG